MRNFSRCGWILVVALVAVPLHAQTDAPKEKQNKKADQPAWKSLFDGKSLDGWQISEFGGGGEVTVEDGRIILGVTDGCTGVTIKGDFPTTDYEVSVEAMRVDGSDFFCGMTFPVGKDPCSLIVGGWGGTVVGLSSINEQDASNNATTKYMKFKTGQWYTVRVRVTKEKIEAWIDDKQVVDQKLEGKRISIRPEVGPSKPFGIASWCTTAALRNIKVRSLK